ncbi:MAG: PilZ domain-containing protein [Roseibium sp.]|uniref:PilZ domain-containing protein n=1 Tax=Roseibium sp. TaxID=1936156 RepID=UPI0026296A20|nr:PilZ domain-containing protein [Roseibium sp.]MCV0426703.1 PilZ domain-containing protein [Roseibium sp.]
MAQKADNSLTTLVVDLADMSCFEAIAHDISDKSCWVVSDKVDQLKEEVGLRLAGFDKLVRGTVVAYGDNEALISFETGKCSEPTEKRREVRRPVWINAVVCGRANPITMKCRIVDASRSGCRLEGDNLNRLPREIDISIPGLDLPIASKIVWRKDGQAGVQLNWPFEPEPDTAPQSLLQKFDEEQAREEAKAKQKPKSRSGSKPKPRISAFGR